MREKREIEDGGWRIANKNRKQKEEEQA